MLEGRYHPIGIYPVTLLDAETGHVFGHATSRDALIALVRLVRSDEVEASHGE